MKKWIFIRRIREEPESKKKLMHIIGKKNLDEGETNSRIWQKTIKSKKIDANIALFGYGIPVKKHEKSKTVMSANFSSRNALKADYRVLEKIN